MRFLLPLGFAAALLSPAAAEDNDDDYVPPVYFVKEQGWTVQSGPRKCDAVNRPLEEFYVAPMNALWLTNFAQQTRTLLRVYYWPGAFEHDEAVTLAFDLKDGKTIEFTGMTTEDFIVDFDYSLTAEDISAIDAAGYVIVRTAGKRDLAFLTRGFADAASHVVKCAAKLKAQP